MSGADLPEDVVFDVGVTARWLDNGKVQLVASSQYFAGERYTETEIFDTHGEAAATASRHFEEVALHLAASAVSESIGDLMKKGRG